MPRTAKARKGESGTKATKPPNRPAPPTKDQIRAIADEAARIAEHIEAGGLSSHAQARIAALRRGPLLACIGAVANQGPESQEVPPARRIDRYGRDVQVPEPRVRVYARPLSREQVAAGEGALLAYLNQILLFCGRASGKTAPEKEIVSGLRAAGHGLRRWAGPAEVDKNKAQEATGGSEPNDLMTLTAVVDRYQVSRATCKRAIELGDLKTHQRKAKGRHFVREKNVRGLYLPRP